LTAGAHTLITVEAVCLSSFHPIGRCELRP